jgi:NDP-sugar pyrophosphorylase family protein
MKGLLNINISDSSWADDFFPECSLYTLPVAGKPLGEYYLDLCSKLGLRSVRIVDFNFDLRWSEKLQEMNQWPLEIDYRGGQYCDDLRKLLPRHQKCFGKDDATVIISGFVFVHYDIRTITSFSFATVQDDDLSSEGVFIVRNGKICRLSLPITPINSILDYFKLNFQVLHQGACYTLPGYKIEDGVFTGMNDVILPTVEISPPVLLGDNVLLQRGCQLVGDVIIGQNVIVDRDCLLKSCIVFDHSYISEGMELVNKIVGFQRIIDPFTEAYILIEDDCFVSDMRNLLQLDASFLFDYLLALLLVVLMTPFYLLAQVWHRLFGRHGRLFYKLSLNRYLRLLKVLRLKYPLVGNSCSPGKTSAFSYSDSFSLSRSFVQRELDDSYFRLHNTFYMRFSIVVKALINRLFVTDAQRSRERNIE